MQLPNKWTVLILWTCVTGFELLWSWFEIDAKSNCLTRHSFKSGSRFKCWRGFHSSNVEKEGLVLWMEYLLVVPSWPEKKWSRKVGLMTGTTDCSRRWILDFSLPPSDLTFAHEIKINLEAKFELNWWYLGPPMHKLQCSEHNFLEILVFRCVKDCKAVARENENLAFSADNTCNFQWGMWLDVFCT